MRSIMDLIREDPFLSKKMTYEEFMNQPKVECEDVSIEEAYASYLKVKEELERQEKEEKEPYNVIKLIE